MLQVFKPYYDQREIDAVSEVLKSGWIGLGPKTKEFEEKFSKYTGIKHSVALNSATAALHIAVRIIKDELGAGEVLVPTMTFVSTAFAAEYEGMKVKFVDIEPDTLNIDINDLKKKITKNTKAVIPVHYGGNPCKIREIMALSRKHGFMVVEDASHAAGSFLGKKHLGSFGHFGVYSFHAVKNLATGDGGMLCTNNRKFADKAHRVRWVGIDKDTYARNKSKGYDWKYEIKELGYKYHMNDITAAIGIVQLEKLEKSNGIRRKLAVHYRKLLKGIEWIEPLSLEKRCKSAQHNFVIKVGKGKDREKIRAYLKGMGISTGVHYLPVHHFTYYKKKGKHSCPVADNVWKKLITLPLYPDMNKKDVETVVRALKEYDSQ